MNNWWKIESVAANVVRWGLGGLLIYSSLPKLAHPYAFLSAVYSYELLPPKAGMFAAMVIPWLEFFAGVCLLGGVFVAGASLTATTLFVVFALVQTSALVKGLDISCGCFGALDNEVISIGTVLRTAGLAAVSMLSIAACFVRPPQTSTAPAAFDVAGASQEPTHNPV